MSTSSAPVDVQIEALKTAAANLLSAPVTALEEVGGGRNSRVYRLRVEPHQSYALKAYFRHASETRARMETEFSSLEFLWSGGVRNIPQPGSQARNMGLLSIAGLKAEKLPHRESPRRPSRPRRIFCAGWRNFALSPV